MLIRLNKWMAIAIAEDLASDRPELKVCLPMHRDPGGSSPWQWTVRIDCRKNDPDWERAARWAKEHGLVCTEWRDINDKVRGIEITDADVDHPCHHYSTLNPTAKFKEYIDNLDPAIAPPWIKRD